MKKLSVSSLVVFAGSSFISSAALAHAGHEGHSSFMTGFLHPLTGWDHLAALLLLGVFVTVSSKKAALLLLAFVSLMLLMGFATGVYWSQVDTVESLVLTSLFALPVCFFLYLKSGLLKSLALVALAIFSACHGVVQGAEAYGVLVHYAAGTLLSSVMAMTVIAVFVKGLVSAKKYMSQSA